MAVTEEQRHDLYTHFQETMGRDRANIMMELLPPVGWGDVATNQGLETAVTLVRKDLDSAIERLESKMDAKLGTMDAKLGTMATRDDLQALEKQFSKFETRMLERMNTHLVTMVGVNTTLFGIAVGVLTLLR